MNKEEALNGLTFKKLRSYVDFLQEKPNIDEQIDLIRTIYLDGFKHGRNVEKARQKREQKPEG